MVRPLHPLNHRSSPSLTARAPTPQSAIFDFSSLIVILLLFICTAAYTRAYTLKRGDDGRPTSMLDRHKGGFRGFAWKAARVGERLSPYVAAACVFMAASLILRG